ncbi:MAG TPA: hypothetical protein GXZ89_00025 [Fastidiosipila sp.]|nr:hypothetical protein [Fastidiosipila sp.]
MSGGIRSAKPLIRKSTYKDEAYRESRQVEGDRRVGMEWAGEGELNDRRGLVGETA